MRLHDTLLGLLLMALAAAVFGYTFTFPEMPGQRYGPALFPRLVALGIAACGGVIAWRGWRSGAPWVAFGEDWQGVRGLMSFLAIPVAVGLYLLLAERLGFLPTATLVVAALCIWFGVRPWAAVLTGVLSAVGVQWFFGSVMRVPLPRGWFMQVISGG